MPRGPCKGVSGPLRTSRAAAAALRLTAPGRPTRKRDFRTFATAAPWPGAPRRETMKVLSSLKSAKSRDRNCRMIRRKGRIYVINKRNPRMKARQG